MKKVKVSIKQNSLGRKFWIFSSSDFLLDWIDLCYMDPNFATKKIPSGAIEITLFCDDYMEVEWYGCEILREEENTWRHLNLVRIGEVRKSNDSSENVVTTHMGWVIDNIIPMKNYFDENIIVKRIDNEQNSINLNELFKQKNEI